MTLAPDFDEFCGLLRDHHVEFVIVGAHALALHGAPRFTGDLDVLVRPTEANAGRLLAAIQAFGFPDIPLSVAKIIEPGTLIEMGVAPVQIQVMSAIDGVTWDEVWAGREVAVFGSAPVGFIGRAEFLKNKRAAGRPKDLADIAALAERKE
ncbi:MAG TPA: hypothetical protein VNT81_07310 [Vicinamibacterales bacterium]|nr:hypothetical protein [Vicinamibacterales bacterium]